MRKSILYTAVLLVAIIVILDAIRVEASPPSQPFLEPPAGCTIGSWQPATPVNTGRSRVGLVYSPVTGKFYLLGGEAAGGNRNIPIEEYDPAANVWTDKSLLTVGVSNIGAAAVGAYIYIPGGYTGASGVADMQRYDPVADTVITMTAMPDVNYAHAVTALDDKVYVLGGSSTGAAGATNYIYDVALDSWSAGAALPTAVQYPAATTDGVYVYVIGGNTINLATVQRYDPAANTWDTIADMNAGRGGAAAFFDGASIWAVGGGWSSYLTSTEYWYGTGWQIGPEMNLGVRTLGAAYGDGLALKAAGWNGTYETAAETIEIDCPPAISIEKTVGEDANACATESQITVAAGASVTYCYEVTNTGGLPLTIHDLEDSELGTILNAFPYNLAPGASAFLTQSVTITTDTVNQATWTAYNPGPSDVVSATDTATVTVLAPDIAVSPLAISETLETDQQVIDALTINNLGNANLEWTVSEAADASCAAADLPWAGAAPAAGTALPAGSSAVVVTFDATGQSPGTYTGALCIASNDPDEPQVIVELTLTVEAPDIAAGPLVIIETLAAGQQVANTLTISNSGQADLDWTVSEAADASCAAADLPWAGVAPAAGTTLPAGSSAVVVTLDATGQAPGTYTGALCITSNDPDEPQVIVVLTLTVEEGEHFIYWYLPVVLR